jgi:alpha-tubulin suppressor-like RCC1 family protein
MAYTNLVENLLPKTYAFYGLYCCGENGSGQLGNNTITAATFPTRYFSDSWKDIAMSGMTTAGIKADGTLWGWGHNNAGGIGDGTNFTTVPQRSSPVQNIAGGTNWVSVIGGKNSNNNSVFWALKTDGTLWGWGANASGQLGTNDRTNRSSPVQTVSGGTNWKQVSAAEFTAAIKTDGTLWMWGQNNFGQLGDNTIVAKSSPIQTVSGGTNWKQVSAGMYATAAIKTDGTLWTWGHNAYGTLGDNTTASKSSPVQTVAGGTNWQTIEVGIHLMGGTKTDGTLWLWGLNLYYGALGDGTATSKSSPVQTSVGGTTWKNISFKLAGSASAAPTTNVKQTVHGIKTDGTIWVWGATSNASGLSDVSVHRSVPVQANYFPAANWKRIAGSSWYNGSGCSFFLV